jgi:hypothetical protein
MAVTTTFGAFYDWPDGGKRHTISYAQHLQNMGVNVGGAPKQNAVPAPPAPPGPPTIQPIGDVRDSQYGAGVNQLIFNNTNQRNDYNRQLGQNTQDFNTMLSRMADARAKDLLAQNYGANREGLFYSGQLGKRRDETNKGYDQKQQDAQTSYDRQQQALNDALQRLGTIIADGNSPTGYSATGQAGFDLGNLYSDATSRAQAAAQNAYNQAFQQWAAQYGG